MADVLSYISAIATVAFNYAPQDWALCYGQLFPVSQYQALYALIRNIYGGNYQQGTFAVPNIQGRVVVGDGRRPGSTTDYNITEMGGLEQQSLTYSNLPAHNHNAVFTSSGTPLSASLKLQVKTGIGSGTSDPVGKYFGPSGSTSLYYSDFTAGKTMAPVNINITGSESGGTVALQPAGAINNPSPVSIMQPFTVLNFIICLDGDYPVNPN